MFRIEILTHGDFKEVDKESDTLSISVYAIISNSSDFMNALKESIDRVPDLIVMHPPFSEETASKALDLFRETGNSRIRKVLITTSQDQLDDWFGFEDGYRTVRVYEPLFKAVFNQFLKHLFEDRFEMNEALIYSVMSMLEHKSSDTPQKLVDAHRNRNIYGAHKMALISSKYPSSRHILWDDLVFELEKLIHLSIKEDSPNEFPFPAIIHPNLDEPLLKNTRRIFLADDEHYRGWSTVLPAILIGRTDLVFLISPVTLRDGSKKYQITKPGDNDFVPILVDNAYSMDIYPLIEKGFFVIKPSDNICEDIEIFLKRTNLNETQRALFPFDLILLDFRLHDEHSGVPVKEVSGHRAAKWLHAQDPSVPIIVVSASDKVWTLLSMRSEGAWDYYLKPGASDQSSIEFTRLEIDRLYRTLKAADKYITWARSIHAIGEWCSLNSGVTSTEEKNTPGSEIRQVIYVVSQTVTSLSRFALDLEEEEGQPTSPVKLAFQMLAMTWESIVSGFDSPSQYLKQLNSQSGFTENTSDLVGFSALSLIARAYRNLQSHNNLHCKYGISFETHLTLWSLALALITLKDSEDIVLQVWDSCKPEMDASKLKSDSIEAVKHYLQSDINGYSRKETENMLAKLNEQDLSLDEMLSGMSHALLGNRITTILDLLIQTTIVCTNEWFQSKRRKKAEHGYGNIYEFACLQFCSVAQRIAKNISDRS